MIKCQGQVVAKTLLEVTQVAWINDTKTSKSPRTSASQTEHGPMIMFQRCVL